MTSIFTYWNEYVHNAAESYDVQGFGSMWIFIPMIIIFWVAFLIVVLSFIILSANGSLHRFSFWVAKKFIILWILGFVLCLIHWIIRLKFEFYSKWYLSNFNYIFTFWIFLFGFSFAFNAIGFTALMIRCIVTNCICPIFASGDEKN